MPGRRVARAAVFAAVVALVAPLGAPLGAPAAAAAGARVRPFSASSWWNTPLPADAPVHPASDAMIEFLRRDNVDEGCVRLSGVDGDRWGMPIYWAGTSDPVHAVRATKYPLPREFSAVRIPAAARPMDSSDAEMVVYDAAAGTVAWFHGAVWDAVSATWSAKGGSIAYVGSNGLDARVAGADDPRNGGTQRGLNGAVSAVHWDDVAAGRIDHVLKVGVRTAGARAVFPMWGSDGVADDGAAPPQGTRLRIRSDVDLDRYGLHPQARVIARALQRYGAVVGDTTGAPVELKLEDTVRSGRGPLWELPPDALCGVPIDAFEVIAEGYTPTPDVEPGAGDVTTPPCDGASPLPVFADVPATSVHASAVSCAASLGVLRGVTATTYAPTAEVTRAQLATILAGALRTAGVDLPDGGDPFSDDDGSPHEAAIGSLAAAGVVRGTAGGWFDPGAPVTRAQLATVVVAALEVAGRPAPAATDRFTDDDGDVHEPSIDRIAAAGIANGTGATTFSPARAVPRDQAASFAVRLLAALSATG